MTSFQDTLVTQSAADSFRAQCEARGIPAEQIAAALAKHGFGQQPAAGQQPQQSGGNDPRGADPHAHVGSLSPTKVPSLNQQEITRAFEHWKAQGLDPQQFIEAAKVDGWSLEDIQGADASATELENDFDNSFGGAAPGDYDLNGVYARDLGEMAGDVGALREVDNDMRAMLGAMGYPQQMARALVSDILDANALNVPEMSDGARAQWRQDQAAVACRVCGVDRNELTRVAAVALAYVPARIRDDLVARGVLDNARVVVALFKHGERMILREGLKQRR